LDPFLPMATPEIQFERELEVFRTEAEAGTQFFYADLAVHAVAADHEPVYKLLNKALCFGTRAWEPFRRHRLSLSTRI